MTAATLSHAASGHFLATLRQLFVPWFTARAAVPARPLTHLEEAEQLRAMADDLLKSDPSLAQDLYAAADRHERA